MELAKLIPVLLQFSIFLVVAALGLRARDHAAALDRPLGLLARSLLTLHIIVPAIVIVAVYVFDPIRPVKIALILLAISPVPPFLPRQLFKLSHDYSFIYSLLVMTSLLSIVFVPTTVAVLGAILGATYWIPISRVLEIVFLTVLLPLATGAAVQWAAPSFAARLEPLVSKLGTTLLLLVVVALLFGTWRSILSLIGDGTVLVIGLVVVLALGVGHLMGGPIREDRVVLALSAAARHPGVAIAIAAYNFPNEHNITAAVVLYLLINGLYSLPYKVWWRRARTASPRVQAPLPH